ncbi:MAG: hypothetical protein H6Q89_4754 [Myxococcaceae bacterium]|nr:hypothetical protein [Myxococcaceae bacterium]
MAPDFKPAAGLMLLIVGGLVINAQLGRTPAPSADERRALYEINWKNFSANCLRRDGGGNPVLETFCLDAAKHLHPLAECDPACREATAGFTR